MDRKSIIKLLLSIGCSLVLFFFIVGKISGINVYLNDNFDENISVNIELPDGTSGDFQIEDFPLVNKGDIVYLNVNLPQDKYIENSTICFFVYHSVIHVYDNDGNLIYEQGSEQAKSGKMIGGTYVAANIPEEAWGKSIMIRLDVQEDNAYSKLHNFMVLKSTDSYKYLMANKEAELMISLAILVFSILAVFTLIFSKTWSSLKRQGIYLSLFLILSSVWFLENNGIFNIFANYRVNNANIEYLSLFCAPIMLCLFFYEQTKREKIKKVQLFLATIFGVFAAVAIVLNYFTVNYHYCRMLAPYHILLLVGMILELIIVLKYNGDDLSSEVLKYGGLVSLLIMFMELFRYNIYKYMNYDIELLSQSIAPFAVIVFVTTILLSYAIHIADHYISKYEKRNLEKLAYYDILTGISNRVGCYRYFESLNPLEENAVIFIDVDNLKYANDVLGHEVGDKLLKFIADSLKDTFGKEEFYGRLGGDEFVVGIDCKNNKIIDEYIFKLKEILAKANEEKLFPFDVSVSYGVSINSKDNPMSIKQLIRDADKKMYENKKKNKKNRL